MFEGQGAPPAGADRRRALFRPPPVAPVAIADACLARQLIHCQSCADECETQAIRFTPRRVVLGAVDRQQSRRRSAHST